jgi:dephospho-CoA kinase
MSNNKLKVGITGGIGSGKTTVCKIFEKFGVPVYYADERAKHLMVSRQEIIDKVKEIFGKKAYLPDGSLDRKYIAGIAFNHPEKLRQLNAVVHPAIHRDGNEWHRQQNVPYTLNEAALMVESSGHKRMDVLIVVTAPEELRIKRVMDRDGVSKQAVLERIKNQLPEEEKVNAADFIIENDGKNSLILQVWDLHKKLIELHEGRRI